MKPTWIRKVWTDNQKIELFADSSQYDGYIVRPFFNLTFTSTSLPSTIKDEIKKLIEDNNGTFVGTFTAANINIVVMDETGMTSAKYKAAIQSKKDCLKPAWIFDSCKMGFALAFDDYRIDAKQKVKVSTQRREFNGTTSKPDWTNLSEIVGQSSIVETMAGANVTVASAIAIGK